MIPDSAQLLGSIGPETAALRPMGADDFPSLHRLGDAAAARGQARHLLFARAELVGVVAASALGGFSFIVPHDLQAGFAIATVVSLIVALAANLVGQHRRDDQGWFDGRAVAESVMTSSWRYMMCVEPYEDAATADRRFAHQLISIVASRPELSEGFSGTPEGEQPVTGRMREVRGWPLAARLAWYRGHRLLPELEWYRARAKRNRRSGKRWFWASLSVQLIAVVAGIFAVVEHPDLDTVAILATVSAAFTAWTHLRRHDDLGTAYGVAAHELLAISHLAEEAVREEELAKVVAMAEGAISREHTMWVARRGDPPAAPTTPDPGATADRRP